MTFIAGIAIEDAVLSDQAARTLGQEDLVAELDRLEDFASLDQVGVSFEDRKQFLFVRNLLSVEHPTARLIEDALPEVTMTVDLLAKRIDGNVAHQIDPPDSLSLSERLASVFYDLRGDADELAIFGHQLFLALFGCCYGNGGAAPQSWVVWEQER